MGKRKFSGETGSISKRLRRSAGFLCIGIDVGADISVIAPSFNADVGLNSTGMHANLDAQLGSVSGSFNDSMRCGESTVSANAGGSIHGPKISAEVSDSPARIDAKVDAQLFNASGIISTSKSVGKRSVSSKVEGSLQGPSISAGISANPTGIDAKVDAQPYKASGSIIYSRSVGNVTVSTKAKGSFQGPSMNAEININKEAGIHAKADAQLCNASGSITNSTSIGNLTASSTSNVSIQGPRRRATLAGTHVKKEAEPGSVSVSTRKCDFIISSEGSVE